MPKLSALTDIGSIGTGAKIYTVVGSSSLRIDFEDFRYSLDPYATLSPQQFGTIDPTGASDSSSAFAACYAEANNLGRAAIRFPRGRFKLSNQVPILTGAVDVGGAGQGATIIDFNHSGTGFQWVGGLSDAGNGNVPTFHDMTFCAAHSGCTVGIQAINTPSAGSPSWNTANFYNLRFTGSASLRWKEKLIHVTDVQLPIFNNVNGQSATTSAQGLVVDGFSLSPKFMYCNLHFFDKAIRLGGTGEGAYVIGCEMIGGNYGVYKEHSPTTEPWMDVHGCHLNNVRSGIFTSGVANLHVSDCLIYAFTAGDGAGWAGIDVRMGREIFLHNNEFFGWKDLGYTGSTVCIALSSLDNAIVDGGSMGAADVGIQVDVNATNVDIGEIKFHNLFQVSSNQQLINRDLLTTYRGVVVPLGRWNFGSLQNTKTAAFYDALGIIGQQGNAKIVLDPGDSRSYFASAGNTMYDVSGNAHHFSKVTSGHPVFYGRYGNLSVGERFVHRNGTTRWIVASNTGFINGLHKDNALVTVGFWSVLQASASQFFFGTNGTIGETGFAFATLASGVLQWFVTNSTVIVRNAFAASLSVPVNTPTFITVTVNEAANAIEFGVDGSFESVAGSYTAPATSDASYLLQMTATGNNIFSVASGTEWGPAFFVQAALTQAEKIALRNHTKSRMWGL